MNLIDLMGGRRHFLSFYCIAQSGVLSYFAKIDSNTYGFIIATVVGAYIAGNVTQKIKEATNEPSN